MAITLTDLIYDPGQDPVGVNAPFDVSVELAYDPIDGVRAGTVRFWTLAAYAVEPSQATVSLPPGEDQGTRRVQLRLRGPAQPELIRIYAECDERHSVWVKVA